MNAATYTRRFQKALDAYMVVNNLGSELTPTQVDNMLNATCQRMQRRYHLSDAESAAHRTRIFDSVAKGKQ